MTAGGADAVAWIVSLKYVVIRGNQFIVHAEKRSALAGVRRGEENFTGGELLKDAARLFCNLKAGAAVLAWAQVLHGAYPGTQEGCRAEVWVYENTLVPVHHLSPKAAKGDAHYEVWLVLQAEIFNEWFGLQGLERDVRGNDGTAFKDGSELPCSLVAAAGSKSVKEQYLKPVHS